MNYSCLHALQLVHESAIIVIVILPASKIAEYHAILSWWQHVITIRIELNEVNAQKHRLATHERRHIYACVHWQETLQ